MADEEVVAAEEVAAVDAPLGVEPYVALPGNCAGELELLPAEAEGLTFNMYKCKECGQIVHVGHEERDVYGLPPQHHKLEEEKS
jgi:hypothetical protein